MSKTSNYQDALQKIREEFQRIPLNVPARSGRPWAQISGESQLLSHALLYLCESMRLDRAALFLLDESTQSLKAQELVDHGDVMAGEEEIVVLPDSPLAPLIAGKRDHLIVEGP